MPTIKLFLTSLIIGFPSPPLFPHTSQIIASTGSKGKLARELYESTCGNRILLIGSIEEVCKEPSTTANDHMSYFTQCSVLTHESIMAAFDIIDGRGIRRK